MNLKNKHVGIWGYGIMGKSALNFLHNKVKNILVLDSKSLAKNEQVAISQRNASFLSEEIDRAYFLSKSDIIVPSGGIDLRPYKKFHHKIVTEPDLFSAFFKKPIIAITGTLGKTTVTEYLAQQLELNGKKVAVGGNIGVGLFDLIDQQNDLDYAVIEVSSFQLEHCKTFAPQLAIWTNFYPNHLDRHTTLDDYFAAKLKILEHQNHDQKALVPENIFKKLPQTLKNNVAVFDHREGAQRYKDLSGFAENWSICKTALQTLGMNLHKHGNADASVAILEHRLEKIATLDGVTLYNDSKATVPEATLAAVNQFSGKPILLLLGGLGKGIDREWLVEALKNRVKKVFCFGKEAELLHKYCMKYKVDAQAMPTLDEAFTACNTAMRSGAVVLLSPGGSSFDLFKNYQERGTYFKELVKKLEKV